MVMTTLWKFAKWVLFFCLLTNAHREWTHQTWNDYLNLGHLLTDLLITGLAFSIWRSLPALYRRLAEDVANRTALKLDRLQRGEIEHHELQIEIERLSGTAKQPGTPGTTASYHQAWR